MNDGIDTETKTNVRARVPATGCTIAIGPAEFALAARFDIPSSHHPSENIMSESPSREFKQELVEDFNAVVARAEQFLQSAAQEGESRTAPLRGHVARKLRLAKDHLRDVEDAVAGKTRETARAADAFVHEHPWRTLGAGAGLGLALGILLGVLFDRRQEH